MDSGFGGSVVTGSSIGNDISSKSSTVRNEGNIKKKAPRKAGAKKKVATVDEAQVNAIVGIQLTVKHAFGSTALPYDGVQSYYSSIGDKDANDRVICRVGKQLAVYNGEGGDQKFLLDRSRNINNVLHFTISSNGRYVSVCESLRGDFDNEDDTESVTAQISIYSLTTYARQKTLNHVCSSDFISTCFSADSKQLVSMTGAPDCLLIVWQWEKEKLLKQINMPSVCTKLGCSPSSHLMLTTSGPGVMKCWHPGPDGVLKSSPLLTSSKENDINFVDHTWLPYNGGGSTQKIVCLTDLSAIESSGNANNVAAAAAAATAKRLQTIYVFEGTEGGAGTMAPGAVPILLDIRQTIIMKMDPDISTRINALIVSAKGFSCVGVRGYVSFYELTEDIREPFSEQKLLCADADEDIIGGTIVPSEEKIILLCRSSRILTVALTAPTDNVNAIPDVLGDSQTRSTVCEEFAALSDDEFASESDEEDKKRKAATAAALAAVENGSAAVTDFTPGGFHVSPIIASDSANQRSILCTLTSSVSQQKDRVLRIWDFEAMKCELTHRFGSTEPLAMAVHYSGFQILVSFKDRVRLYFILMDKLKQCKETVLKACKHMQFCNNGQYWAAASSINVVVFDTQSFAQLMTFQGHMLSVQCLVWEIGDQQVFSAGQDGNVYGWQSTSDQRIDIVPSSVHSAHVASMTCDSQSPLFAVASEYGDEMSSNNNAKALAAAQAAKSSINRVISAMVDGDMRITQYRYNQVSGGGGSHRSEVQVLDSLIVPGDGPKFVITALKMSSNRKHMYAGMSNGKLRIYAWAATGADVIDAQQPVYMEYNAHTSAVVDVRENSNRTSLISCAEDGTIFVHAISVFEAPQVAGTAAAAVQKEKDIFSDFNLDQNEDQYQSGTVLMSTDDIEEHIVQIVDLQKKLSDAQSKFSFELHQRETAHTDEVKILSENMAAEVASEHRRYDEMHVTFTKRTKELTSNISDLESSNLKAIAEIENRYEHKLAMQLDRYDKVCEEMETLAQQCDGLLKSERSDFSHQINELKNEARLHEKKMKAETRRVREDRVADEGAFKEILDQQEDEYECELRELISAAEGEIGSERENISKLRTLVQTKNTKLDQMKKKLQELSVASKARLALLHTERKERIKLQDTIEHYKRNLLEREEALMEKEKVILDLRNTTRTLENFRFVLNHRLQQLSSERGPITTHIENLEHHISTMYEELVDEFDLKKQNGIQNGAKDHKITIITRDNVQLRTEIKTKEMLIAAFRRELSIINASSVKGKDLEDMVLALCHKFMEKGGAGPDLKKQKASKAAKSSSVAVKKAKELIGTSATLVGEDNFDSGSESDGESGAVTSKKGKRSGGRASKGLIKEVEEELIESAKEAERQKLFVERSSTDLKHRLDRTKAEAVRVTKTRLNENSSLMYECNDLRREVRELNRKLDLTTAQLGNTERALRQARANGLPESPSVIFPPPYYSGLGDSPEAPRNDSMRSTAASVADAVRNEIGADTMANVYGAYGGTSADPVPPGAGPGAPKVGLGPPILAASPIKPFAYKAANQTTASQLLSNSQDDMKIQPVVKPNVTKLLNTRHRPGGGSTISSPTGGLSKHQNPTKVTLADRAVEKLTGEVEQLVGQLDIAAQERNTQSKEIIHLLGVINKAGISTHNMKPVTPITGDTARSGLLANDSEPVMGSLSELYGSSGKSSGPRVGGSSLNSLLLGQRHAVRDGQQAIVMDDMNIIAAGQPVPQQAKKGKLVARLPKLANQQSSSSVTSM